jgi:hypothetical protein
VHAGPGDRGAGEVHDRIACTQATSHLPLTRNAALAPNPARGLELRQLDIGQPARGRRAADDCLHDGVGAAARLVLSERRSTSSSSVTSARSASATPRPARIASTAAGLALVVA